MRALGAVGTLIVASAIAFGNYGSRASYEATKGQPMLVWLVPSARAGAFTLLDALRIVLYVLYLRQRGIRYSSGLCPCSVQSRQYQSSGACISSVQAIASPGACIDVTSR